MLLPSPVSSEPGCTKTIEPDANGYVPPGTCGYHGKMYYPSFNLAAIFSTISAMIMLGHLLQAFRHPKSSLQKFAVFAAACLFSGYVARTLGTHHQQDIYIAAFSDTMILVCPTSITAFDCGLFVALVKFYTPNKAVAGVNSRLMSRIFFISISLLTVIQLLTCAAIVTGNPPGIQRFGITTYMVSIGAQQLLVIFVLSFVVMLQIYLTKLDISKPRIHSLVRWEIVCVGLYLSLGAIFLRIGYRLIELHQVFQADGTLAHKEIFFYCFEATPTLIAFSVWVVIPTGSLTEHSCSGPDFEYQEIYEASREDVPLDDRQ